MIQKLTWHSDFLKCGSIYLTERYPSFPPFSLHQIILYLTSHFAEIFPSRNGILLIWLWAFGLEVFQKTANLWSRIQVNIKMGKGLIQSYWEDFEFHWITGWEIPPSFCTCLILNIRQGVFESDCKICILVSRRDYIGGRANVVSTD